ncbi:MAG: DNA mismatch repair endonuclease MutL [Bacteroidales bacterium]|jgi:DNA mismatch repair protein MutL|nr:DNA mismatch repair endonuclease MutL [Bacteroidales bacterium]MDY0369788.1 DNA mismatch repair endonuclease MutL [Bacteroidales bacterium]
MSDIIKLLPDSVANQIAAGEVIQRPASVVKELLENAIDAGASQIDLVIRDAGKSLIQLTDNGSGMSVTDARMAFERHATSKINKADDLFAIRTMGFRGEALASIAAIAQVELKTRTHDSEYGTLIRIEGSVVKSQEVNVCQPGTSFSVKNLFFNVPARRNFLKSPTAEMRHILEEFHRVSLIHPEIGFTLVHNDKEIFYLMSGSLKQRIVALLGNVYNERLLHVSQRTETMSVEGFIVKAEFARKTRGEQYFFVNKRFIKHPYLHHAVENAYQELLPRDSFPSYFLHIEIDPSNIDINIHPTKTEVNFQDTRLVYAVIHAAIKKTLGQFSLSPRLDFDSGEAELNVDFGEISRAGRPVTRPEITVNPEYNPFTNPIPVNQEWQKKQEIPTENWRLFYERQKTKEEQSEDEEKTRPERHEAVRLLQIQNSFIITPVKSGLLVIDQYLAHWRILYERYMKQLDTLRMGSQQELFPQTIQLNAGDAELLVNLLPDLMLLGFSIETMGSRTFVVNGTPEGVTDRDITAMIEHILEMYKINQTDLQLSSKQNLARSLSASLAVKHGQQLSDSEMNALIDQLFACEIPQLAPDGTKLFNTLTTEQIQQFIKQA